MLQKSSGFFPSQITSTRVQQDKFMPCLHCTTMLSSGSALSVCASSSFALSLCYVISEEPRGLKKKQQTFDVVIKPSSSDLE